VQALLSLHGLALLLLKTHPVAAEHESSVHAFPSLHVTASLVHTQPPEFTQRSLVVHMFVSAQTLWLGWQVPSWPATLQRKQPLQELAAQHTPLTQLPLAQAAAPPTVQETPRLLLNWTVSLGR
jgi:hypothetical protein